jgi:tripartite ATP-independent transporter DctM subunit
MDQIYIILLLILALFVLLGAGLWVAMALLAVGMLAMTVFTSAPAGTILATSIWGASNSWALAALPMFIWMGEILFRTRLSKDMFVALSPWMNHIPGRLLHVNVLGCGIFAAVSGSSAATAATIGKMSIPELEKRGYDRTMVLGTLAGSGTLGLLIPPSIILIVYGVAIEESIARLFIAGVIPGLILVIMFMGYIMVWALLNPQKMPPAEPRIPYVERIKRSKALIPIFLLIAGVIGSIYLGWASPTDAAAIGVVLALLLSWATGSLTKASFIASLMGATRTSAMIAFILAGAAFLTVAMGFTGIPRKLAEVIATFEFTQAELLIVLTLFFVVLGCFLDGISVVVLTVAVIQPIIEHAGIDPLWFGIFIVIVVEMAQITPPVGFNLFVIQGLTGENILRVAKAAMPFFFLLLAGVVVISVFPETVTWLPQKMTAR